MAKNGLPFGMGHFEMNGAIFTVTDFVVYNDGIVAVAEKTDWAEAFLQDITNWGHAVLWLPRSHSRCSAVVWKHDHR